MQNKNDAVVEIDFVEDNSQIFASKYLNCIAPAKEELKS